MIILAALALLGAQADKAPDPAPVPLEPSAKWIAEFQDSFCGISRAFGESEKGPIFGVKSMLPQDTTIEILLITHDRESYPNETLTVADAADADKAVSGHVRQAVTADKNWTIRMATVERDGLMEIADGRPLRINYGKRSTIVIHPVNMTGAVKMLGTCEVALAKHWGLDPSIVERIATPAKGASSFWVTYNDYPQSALAKGHQGSVVIVWDIDLSGHVSNCRVLSSSGYNDLDQAACDAIERRARYTSPALDKDGKPMISYQVRRVVWSLGR